MYCQSADWWPVAAATADPAEIVSIVQQQDACFQTRFSQAA
jgi:hypothetical protein